MDSGSPADRLTHDIPDDETSELKALCDKRNNARITEYFKSKDDSTALKTNAADLFHFAVLQLTCNNDPDSPEEAACLVGTRQPLPRTKPPFLLVHFQFAEKNRRLCQHARYSLGQTASFYLSALNTWENALYRRYAPNGLGTRHCFAGSRPTP